MTWGWNEVQQTAFDTLRNLLATTEVYTYGLLQSGDNGVRTGVPQLQT